MSKLAKGQWSEQKAWDWYNSREWIVGFNGYPSNCVNRIAIWQEYNHKEVFEQIEYEFALARDVGFNAVRAIPQFEVWYYQHDSFMRNFEEYLTLADKYGLKVMVVLGNDCTVPKSRFKPVVFGEQKVDWGYHSGIKQGPHTGDYKEPGYQLLDDPEFTEKYYEMVGEYAKKYGKDERIQIWDVWNEIDNSNRGSMSLKHMEKFFEILRENEVIQPLTADCWRYSYKTTDLPEPEKRALELSDVITFHCYGKYEDFVLLVERLKKEFNRPLICDEWLNRLEGNDIFNIFPFLHAEKIGSYHWGLIQGYSQTFEPWGGYFIRQRNGEYVDTRLWQHDLFRFNGLPYDQREIDTIKKFTSRK